MGQNSTKSTVCLLEIKRWLLFPLTCWPKQIRDRWLLRHNNWANGLRYNKKEAYIQCIQQCWRIHLRYEVGIWQLRKVQWYIKLDCKARYLDKKLIWREYEANWIYELICIDLLAYIDLHTPIDYIQITYTIGIKLLLISITWWREAKSQVACVKN